MCAFWQPIALLTIYLCILNFILHTQQYFKNKIAIKPNNFLFFFNYVHFKISFITFHQMLCAKDSSQSIVATGERSCRFWRQPLLAPNVTLNLLAIASQRLHNPIFHTVTRIHHPRASPYIHSTVPPAQRHCAPVVSLLLEVLQHARRGKHHTTNT